MIDADRLSHRLLTTETRTGRKIVQEFGTVILTNGCLVDRKKLARLAFADTGNWQTLCRIIHPEVIRLIKKEIRRACQDKIKAVVIDAALLIEAGVERLADYIIVVKAGLNQQLARTRKRLGLSGEDFKKRISFQLSFKEKLKKADFFIDNRKTLKFTERQVDAIWKRIMPSRNR